MNKQIYSEEITIKFKKALIKDYKNNIISEPIYNLFLSELKYSSSFEYKYGLYTSYLIMIKCILTSK